MSERVTVRFILRRPINNPRGGIHHFHKRPPSPLSLALSLSPLSSFFSFFFSFSSFCSSSSSSASIGHTVHFSLSLRKDTPIQAHISERFARGHSQLVSLPKKICSPQLLDAGNVNYSDRDLSHLASSPSRKSISPLVSLSPLPSLLSASTHSPAPAPDLSISPIPAPAPAPAPTSSPSHSPSLPPQTSSPLPLSPQFPISDPPLAPQPNSEVSPASSLNISNLNYLDLSQMFRDSLTQLTERPSEFDIYGFPLSHSYSFSLSTSEALSFSPLSLSRSLSMQSHFTSPSNFRYDSEERRKLWYSMTGGEEKERSSVPSYWEELSERTFASFSLESDDFSQIEKDLGIFSLSLSLSLLPL